MLWGWFRETCGLTLLKGENTHQVKNERTVHASTKKEVVQKEMESSSKHHFFRGELLVSVSGDASRIWTFRIMGPNPGWKLIWPWKITMFNWRSIFKWLSFRCHVKIFWGVFVDGISSKSNKNPIYPWIQSFVEVGFPPKNGLLYCFFRKGIPFWVYKPELFVGEISGKRIQLDAKFYGELVREFPAKNSFIDLGWAINDPCQMHLTYTVKCWF